MLPDYFLAKFVDPGEQFVQIVTATGQGSNYSMVCFSECPRCGEVRLGCNECRKKPGRISDTARASRTPPSRAVSAFK